MSPHRPGAAVGSMAIARRQLNATLLPDGKVLVTGGTSGPGFNNPDVGAGLCRRALGSGEPNSGRRSPAARPIPRIYHSSALLLPDGASLEHGRQRSIRETSEIYSPPYLFNAGRERGPRSRQRRRKSSPTDRPSSSKRQTPQQLQRSRC